MRKYIFLATAFLCGILVSCGTTAVAKNFGFTKTDSYSIWNIRFKDEICDYVDDETGVHYFAIFDQESLNALCPRYNSDGSLMVDK